jgi:hypothetical protein
MQQKDKIYEFALFSLNKSKYNQYLTNYPDFQKFAGSLKGFNALMTFQDLENKLVILDHAIWNSISDVQEADKEIQSNPKCKKLLDPMEQVLLFENTILVNERRNTDVDNYGILELNVVEVEENVVDDYLEAKQILFDKIINEADGLLFIESFKSIISENTYIEKLGWLSKEFADTAYKRFKNSTEFQKYNKLIKEMKFFHQMKPLEILK